MLNRYGMVVFISTGKVGVITFGPFFGNCLELLISPASSDLMPYLSTQLKIFSQEGKIE
jgi:hypothetical protein